MWVALQLVGGEEAASRGEAASSGAAEGRGARGHDAEAAAARSTHTGGLSVVCGLWSVPTPGKREHNLCSTINYCNKYIAI